MFQKKHRINLGRKQSKKTIRKRIETRRNNKKPWHSEKTKKKIGKSKIGNTNTLGKHWKVKDTSKYSKAKRGKKRKPFLEEHIKNLKESSKKRWDRIGRKETKTRQNWRYIKWRILVYRRDDFTCQLCKQVGKNLEAHHIKSWSKYPKLRYNINNGITLCKKCHKLVTKFKIDVVEYNKILKNKKNENS